MIFSEVMVASLCSITYNYILFTSLVTLILPLFQGARVRTQGEGSMNTNSATTQTQESSFTIPVTWSPLNARAADSCQTPRYIRERQTHVEMSPISIQSTTVSTQTPMFMMPVAQLVYDIQERRGDYSLGLLVSGRDDPPPPYSAAVSR